MVSLNITKSFADGHVAILAASRMTRVWYTWASIRVRRRRNAAVLLIVITSLLVHTGRLATSTSYTCLAVKHEKKNSYSRKPLIFESMSSRCLPFSVGFEKMPHSASVHLLNVIIRLLYAFLISLFFSNRIPEASDTAKCRTLYYGLQMSLSHPI
jgi:hypothetical protein